MQAKRFLHNMLNMDSKTNVVHTLHGWEVRTLYCEEVLWPLKSSDASSEAPEFELGVAPPFNLLRLG